MRRPAQPLAVKVAVEDDRTSPPQAEVAVSPIRTKRSTARWCLRTSAFARRRMLISPTTAIAFAIKSPASVRSQPRQVEAVRNSSDGWNSANDGSGLSVLGQRIGEYLKLA
jgi:hypothetical protein